MDVRGPGRGQRVAPRLGGPNPAERHDKNNLPTVILVAVAAPPDVMQAPDIEAQPVDQPAHAAIALPISSAIQREVIPHTFPLL